MLLTLRARSSALNHFSSFFRVVLCNVKTACFPAAPLHMKSRSEIREIVQSATLMRRCWSPAIMSTLPYKSAFVDAGIASGSRCNPSLSVYGAHAKLGRYPTFFVFRANVLAANIMAQIIWKAHQAECGDLVIGYKSSLI